jgi:ABC-type Zn uptake system ZnuABC Zn-binding protein ZnuA
VGVGPASPVRSAKRCDSGEWVTEPAAQLWSAAMGPARLAREVPAMTRGRSVLLAVALVLLASVRAGAGVPLHVVTTSTDLKSLVEAVGGDRVRVVSLAPPIHEPHVVEVKPSQLAELRAATLLVRIGLDHEPWLARLLTTVNAPRLSPGGPADVDTSKGIELLQTETARVRPERGVHVHGFGNPHYWLDPENARPITASILEALGRAVPADRDVFERNRNRFLVDLERRLVRWTEATQAYRGTRVVVAHDSWPYFARRFGLEIAAALEPTPGVPPSPSYLASLIERMKATGIRLVIAGPESDAALVKQVAARSGARAVTLVPSVGGDPAARDYLSLFDLDVERLREALSGSR